MQLIGALLFALALLHTFSAKAFERLSHQFPRHAGLLHLLGEVEVVFGFWAMVLLVAMAFVAGPENAIAYAETQQYTEPLFVFVVMVVAASRPVLDFMQRIIGVLSGGRPLLQAWLGLALVPLAGSLITEPAAMTLAALMLAPQIFRNGVPEWQKYAALGILFVNVSVGGTLTAYAAPPVLMVAATWQWDSAFMAANFGWKATLAVLINASAATWLLRDQLRVRREAAALASGQHAPLFTSMIHLAFLAAVVLLAHHPVLFLGLFLFFLGFTTAYPLHQSPLILKEALLVGFFLAGLVVLGSIQQWWLQPIVESLQPVALFFGALGLTAITDNAALTYLGSLIDGIKPQAQYMLVAGAVAGGGLTVIANAPNPAGVALLRKGFRDESISSLGLLAGALAPTAVAAAAFFL